LVLRSPPTCATPCAGNGLSSMDWVATRVGLDQRRHDPSLSRFARCSVGATRGAHDPGRRIDRLGELRRSSQGAIVPRVRRPDVVLPDSKRLSEGDALTMVLTTESLPELDEQGALDTTRCAASPRYFPLASAPPTRSVCVTFGARSFQEPARLPGGRSGWSSRRRARFFEGAV
jgi:hypothetical protein